MIRKTVSNVEEPLKGVENGMTFMLGAFGLSEEQGNEIIMAARAHWFEDEDAPAEAGEEGESEPTS